MSDWKPPAKRPDYLGEKPRMSLSNKDKAEQHLHYAAYHLAQAKALGMWTIKEHTHIQDDLRRLDNYVRINRGKPVIR